MSGSEDCVRFSYKLTTEGEILQQKLKGASQRQWEGSLCFCRGHKRKKKEREAVQCSNCATPRKRKIIQARGKGAWAKVPSQHKGLFYNLKVEGRSELPRLQIQSRDDSPVQNWFNKGCNRSVKVWEASLRWSLNMEQYPPNRCLWFAVITVQIQMEK